MFPTVVQDILSVLVVTVVMAPPLMFTKMCGRVRRDTTRKDHEKNFSSLKYDVTPAPNGANWLILPCDCFLFPILSKVGLRRPVRGLCQRGGLREGWGLSNENEGVLGKNRRWELVCRREVGAPTTEGGLQPLSLETSDAIDWHKTSKLGHAAVKDNPATSE